MSKQYETWEVIKLIGENPDLKFQTMFSDGITWEAFSRRDNKGVRCIYGKGLNSEDEDFLSSDSNTMSRKWNMVDDSVDFMEAIKALHDGKEVYVMHDADFKYKEIFSPKSNKTDWGYAMNQQQGYAVDTGLILYGKWYIKD